MDDEVCQCELCGDIYNPFLPRGFYQSNICSKCINSINRIGESFGTERFEVEHGDKS